MKNLKELILTFISVCLMIWIAVCLTDLKQSPDSDYSYKLQIKGVIVESECSKNHCRARIKWNNGTESTNKFNYLIIIGDKVGLYCDKSIIFDKIRCNTIKLL